MFETVFMVALLLILTFVNGCLHTELRKSGSHREFFTRLEIPATYLTVPVNKIECKVLFLHSIPSGAYVDPYQLDSLRPFGGPDFYLRETIDVEQPEFSSKEFKIFIYSNFTKPDNVWRIEYTLPIHLRYHAVSSNDFAVIKFTNPEVGLRCVDTETSMDYHAYSGKSDRIIKELCDSSSKWLCDWAQLNVESDTREIQVRMPVGKEGHYMIVTIGTVATTIIGFIVLIYVSWTSNNKYKHS